MGRIKPQGQGHPRRHPQNAESRPVPAGQSRQPAAPAEEVSRAKWWRRLDDCQLTTQCQLCGAPGGNCQFCINELRDDR